MGRTLNLHNHAHALAGVSLCNNWIKLYSCALCSVTTAKDCLLVGDCGQHTKATAVNVGSVDEEQLAILCSPLHPSVPYNSFSLTHL